MTSAKPFVKWVGGKTNIIYDVLGQFPARVDNYIEPFLGGGSVLFRMINDQRCGSSYGNDACNPLIHAYHAVRDTCEPLIQRLKAHPFDDVSEEAYYAIRDERAAMSENRIEDAARFIYLNKVGFRGLYRVNKSGGFNVPYGHYANPTVCDEPNLRECATALRTTKLASLDFEEYVNVFFRSAKHTEDANLLYFDPPYVPQSATHNFTSYTANGFAGPDQERLARLFERLTLRGDRCVLSNSLAARPLYEGKGYAITVLEARRAITSNRPEAVAEEILVSNRPRLSSW